MTGEMNGMENDALRSIEADTTNIEFRTANGKRHGRLDLVNAASSYNLNPTCPRSYTHPVWIY